MMLTACSLQVAILSKYRTPSNDSVFQVQRSPLIIENRVNWSRPLEVINFKTYSLLKHYNLLNYFPPGDRFVSGGLGGGGRRHGHHDPHLGHHDPSSG